MMDKVDLDHDGVISKQEADSYTQISRATLQQERDKNHIKLAWVAMISIIGVTLLLFTPFVSVDKIEALNDILDLFYIAQASVIGFYMGAKTYLERNK